jgi:molybdenum cofactor cytidylyltransferase
MPGGGSGQHVRGTVRVAAVVLAAGRSTRMGAQNKLLADLGGRPMVRWVVEAVLASKASSVLVVTGHMAADVGAALGGLDVTLVANSGYATGLASSLKAGIRAVPAGCDGALILLGDMPGITAELVDRLVETFTQAGDCIVVPVHKGRQGNPALWPRRFFPELLQLDGDAGARRLFADRPEAVRAVPVADDAIFSDIDTPEALARVRAGSGMGRRAD